MKIRATSEHQYPWPVTVRLPDPEHPGVSIKQTFTATFRAPLAAERAALEEPIETVEAVRRRDDVLRRAIIDWEGVEDGSGLSVSFSPEALQAAIQLAWFRAGVHLAYVQSLQADAHRRWNLAEAARAWTLALLGKNDPRKPAPVDVVGFAALGLTVKPRSADEAVFELWDVNVPAFELFLAVQTQWRFAIAPHGHLVRIGLDYAGVQAAMRLGRFRDDGGRLFTDLQAMEFSAIEVFGSAGR